MIDPMYIVTLLAPFAIFYLFLRWTYKGPPHVTGVPLLGYVPFLGKEPYLVFQDIIKKRGPIFSMYMGSLYTVVLSSYDVIHEAFIEKGNVFNDRPSCVLFRIYDYETAFSVNSGEDWKVMRNFSMNALKHLGLGKNFTKNFMQTEIQDFINELKCHEGKPIDVDRTLSKSTGSLVLSLLTGKKYDRSDETGWMADTLTTAADLMRSYSFDVGGMFPWLGKIPFLNKVSTRKTSRTLKHRLWKLMEEEIASSKKTFNHSSEPENFIHSWYMEQEKRYRQEDPQKHLFSDFNLKNTLDMLVQGASDTSSVNLLWAFLYLLIHPDIQRRLHQEIDEYIGENREPCLGDKMNMHYTKAFLTEVQRVANISPLGAFHSNRVKSSIMGYEIPKDSVIISDLWNVHHDPNYFPDPYKFDPKRFLDEHKKFKPSEYMSAFSFGRRICPGKQVAEMQVFLYLVSILQVFELRSPSGSHLTDKDSIYDKTLIRHPVPYEIIFHVRNRRAQ